MWGFASQAGAGMAIATLTATYYALVRRNYQMERELAIALDGQGDGQMANSSERKRNNHQPLNASQMLLKKELEELSFLNGKVSGLNVLYQQEHPWYKFQKSHIELDRIISRVNTRPSTSFSEEEFNDRGGGDGDASSIFGSEPEIDPSKKIIASRDPRDDELPETRVQTEKVSDSVEDKESRKKEEELLQEAGEDLEEENSNALHEESSSVVEKWRSIQDNLSLNRTQSPICFYKNPGFGNRYAFRIKEQAKSSPSPETSKGEVISTKKLKEEISPVNDCQNEIEIKRESSTTESLSSKSDKVENSTQFILSPVLSESNASVCEKEIPDKLRIKAPTAEDECLKAENKNTLKEISAYNETLNMRNINSDEGNEEGAISPLALKSDSENCDFCPDPEPVTTPMPIVEVPTPGKEESCLLGTDEEKTEKLFMLEKLVENIAALIDDKNNEIPSDLQVEDNAIPDPVNPSSITVIMKPTSIVTCIPEDSWMSLPARIYANSMTTMPWTTIVVCIAVVVIAGFLGMVMSKLANDIIILKEHRNL